VEVLGQAAGGADVHLGQLVADAAAARVQHHPHPAALVDAQLEEWLPEPSVPNCLAAFTARSADSSVAGRWAASQRSALRFTESWPWPTPAGMTRSTRTSSGSSESGSRSSVTSSSAATMPQPMSTPTAAGITAPRVGITEPTVAPMPTWASGMRATWPSMIGRRAVFSAWRMAPGSMSVAHEMSLGLMVTAIAIPV